MTEYSQLLTKLQAFHADGRINSAESLAMIRQTGIHALQLGRYDEAESILGDCISRSVTYFGTASEESMTTMTKLCEVYAATKRHQEADRTYHLFFKQLNDELTSAYAHDLLKVQEVVDLWKKYGREKDVNHFADFLHTLQLSSSDADPHLAVQASYQFTLSKLGNMTHTDVPKVQALFVSCLQRAQTTLDAEDPQLFNIKFDYAVFLEEKACNFSEAETMYSNLIEMRKTVTLNAVTDAKFLQVTTQYANMLFTIGQHEKAIKSLEDITSTVSDSTAETISDAMRKVRLNLAWFYEMDGRHVEAMSHLNVLDIPLLPDSLDNLQDAFQHHTIVDGLYPIPITNPSRETIYEDLHRNLRSKLGAELSLLTGNWSAPRLPYLLTLAKISARLPAHAAEAIPLFDAVQRNAIRIYTREHPFTIRAAIDAMEFHVFRLTTKDLASYHPALTALCNDAGAFAKLRGMPVMQDSYCNIVRYFLLLASVEKGMTTAATLETVKELIGFWETSRPTKSIEIRRLHLLLALLVAKDQPEEADTLVKAQMARSSHRDRAYLSVMGKKVLLDVLLKKLSKSKARGSINRAEVQLIYRQVIGLYRHLFGCHYGPVQALIVEAGQYFEDADEHDLAEALYVESIDAIKAEHPDLPLEKLNKLTEMKFLNERMDRFYLPNNISLVYQRAEKGRTDKNYSAVEPLYRTVIRRRTKALGISAYETLVARNGYSVLLWNIQRYTEAARELEEILALRIASDGERDAFTLRIQFNLANVYKYLGRLDKSSELYRICVAGRRATLGDSQKETLNAMYYYAGSVAAQHHYREAYSIYLQCRTLRAAAFGSSNSSVNEVNTAISQFTNQATVDMLKRRSAEAQRLPYQDYLASFQLLSEAVFLYEQMFPARVGDSEAFFFELLYERALAQRFVGRIHATDSLFKEVLQRQQARITDVDERLLAIMREYATLLLMDNRPAEVLELYQSVLTKYENRSDLYVTIACQLGDFYLSCMEWASAELWFNNALQRMLSPGTSLIQTAVATTGSAGSSSLPLISEAEVRTRIEKAQSASADEVLACYVRAAELYQLNRVWEAKILLSRQPQELVASVEIRLSNSHPAASIPSRQFRLKWIVPNSRGTYADAVADNSSPLDAVPLTVTSTAGSADFALPVYSLTVLEPSTDGESDGLIGEKSPLAALANLSNSQTLTSSSGMNSAATAKKDPFFVTVATAPTMTTTRPETILAPSMVSTNNPPLPGGGGFTFGNSAPASSAPSTGSIFGTNSNNTSSSLFGGGSSNNTTGSIFGGGSGSGSGSSNSNNGGGLFSGSSNNTTGSIFGGGSGSSNSNNGGGLFSGSSNNNNNGGGLFSGSSNNNNNGGGLFGSGSNNTTGSIFGGGAAGGNNNSNTSGGLFGNSSFNTTTTSSNFFSNASGVPPAPAPAGNLFGNTPSSTGNGFSFGSASTASTFGSSPPSQPPSASQPATGFGSAFASSVPSNSSFGARAAAFGFSNPSGASAPAPTPAPAPAPTPARSSARGPVRAAARGSVRTAATPAPAPAPARAVPMPTPPAPAPGAFSFGAANPPRGGFGGFGATTSAPAGSSFGASTGGFGGFTAGGTASAAPFGGAPGANGGLFGNSTVNSMGWGSNAQPTPLTPAPTVTPPPAAEARPNANSNPNPNEPRRILRTSQRRR